MKLLHVFIGVKACFFLKLAYQGELIRKLRDDTKTASQEVSRSQDFLIGVFDFFPYKLQSLSECPIDLSAFHPLRTRGDAIDYL